MHRLETKSQSEQIDTLSTQLAEKDTALKLIASQASKADEAATAAKVEVAAGVEAYEKVKIVAKEEEEKRIKALCLLRALRQKLVKSEKDKEEGEREREALKAAELAAQETLRTDRQRFDQEVVSLRAAQEQQLSKLRNSFDREAAQLRTQHEREATARKGQYELDAITAKAAQAKELSTKEARIQQLEATVREMTSSRDALFDRLQLKTAEVESSTSHQESLQEKTGELQYELKEAKDRTAALVDELEEVRRAQRDVTRDDTNTRRLLLEAEARHDAKVRDLEVRAKGLEKERQETEEEMGRNLQERLREVERMRQQIVQKDIDYAESVQSRQLRDAKIAETETQNRALETKLKGMDGILADLRDELEKSSQAEVSRPFLLLPSFSDADYRTRLRFGKSFTIGCSERRSSRVVSRRFRRRSPPFARTTRCVPSLRAISFPTDSFAKDSSRRAPQASIRRPPGRKAAQPRCGLLCLVRPTAVPVLFDPPPLSDRLGDVKSAVDERRLERSCEGQQQCRRGAQFRVLAECRPAVRRATGAEGAVSFSLPVSTDGLTCFRSRRRHWSACWE